MSLEKVQNLPGEVWASIVIHLSGECIGRLKITGSSVLWRKLIEKHIVKSIIFGTDLVQLKRWPAFLNELPSVEIFAIWNEHDAWWDSWKPNFLLVTKALRKLQIKASVICTESFFRQSDHSIASLAESFPQLEYLDLNMDWSEEIPWMCHTPETLTFLKCLNWFGNHGLPESLIHLEIESNIRLHVPVEFPPQLETITAVEIEDLDLLVLGLPASFRKLKCNKMSTKFIRNPDMKLLSTFPMKLVSLGHVQMERSIFSDPRLITNPEEVSMIPPFLTSLEISFLPVQIWPYLPATLNHLTVHRLGDTWPAGKLNDIHVYPIHVLPRGIVDLTLGFVPITLIDGDEILQHDPDCSCERLPAQNGLNQLFPPNLTSLALFNGLLADNSFKYLPSSLKHLSIPNLDVATCSCLPRSLTSLTALSMIQDPSFFELLPVTLTELVLSNPSPIHAWIDPISGELSSVRFAMSEDATLWTFSSEFLWKGEYCLSPNLVHLELHGYECLDDRIVSQPLTKLNHLEIRTPTNLTNSCIPLLPRSLTHLNLENSPQITGKSFSYLPRELLWLGLSSSEDVNDCDIQHLPRSLQVLLLDSASLSDACVKNLPRPLEVFIFNNLDQRVTLASINELPYRLKRAQRP